MKRWLALVGVMFGMFLLFALPLLAGGASVYLPLVSTPPDVLILPNHSAFYREGYYTAVMGELVNQSGETTRHISLTVQLLSGERVVEERAIYTGLQLIPHGTKSCFWAAFYATPEQWDTYHFVTPIQYRPVGAGVEVIEYTVVASRGEHWDGAYRVAADLRNDSGSDASGSFGRVAVTLYDAAGTVLDCWREVPGSIPPRHAATTYTVTLNNRDNYSGVVSHQVQANAMAAP